MDRPRFAAIGFDRETVGSVQRSGSFRFSGRADLIRTTPRITNPMFGGETHENALRERWWRRLATIGMPMLIIALVLTPLIVGATWMYASSSKAFRFQHRLRVAQNARARVVKLFLSSEANVRGFAATGDQYFAARYREQSRFVGRRFLTLESGTQSASVPGGREIVSREEATYAQWMQHVAGPILASPRSRSRRLLRYLDPTYTAAVLDDDRQLGRLLDGAAVRSENDRQHLLRQILTGSELLVAIVTASVGGLLYARARAQRQAFVQRALYAEEQRITVMLQLALTPERLPTISGIALSAIYVPAGSTLHVGGDWYEVFELSDGRVFLLIGDVAGHGLEAAVTMNRARQSILAAAITEATPARILMRANRLLCAQSAGMVTAACCVFDPGLMRIEYATAGHPPPIVVPVGSPPYVLSYGGAPMGIFDDLVLDSRTMLLTAGSTVVFYTDGLIEEEYDVVAGEKRLLVAAEQHRFTGDLAAALFKATISDGKPRDDVAILTMRLAAPSSGTRKLSNAQRA